MNTSLGYAKKTLNDTSVLLSGGGDKPLSDFIGSISWDSTNKKIKYTPIGASSATDLVTFGSNAFNSTSYLPLSGGTMTGSITMGTNIHIYGAIETYGSMLFFNGSKTIVGSAGETTTEATHIRSKTGHATIGKSLSGTYNILDSGNSSVSLDGLTLTVKINDVTLSLTNSTYSTFVKSGTNAAAGLVPAPSTTEGTSRFLCEDATWKELGSNAFTSTSFVTTSTEQTISATKTFVSDNLGEAITVKRNTNSGSSVICFSNKGGVLGYIGVSNGIPGFWDSSKNANVLLTSTNWSTYVGTSSTPVGYATNTTNIAGGAQGSIPYLTAAGTTAFLAGGTNGYVLAYNTTSKAPYWKADSNTQYYLTLNGTTNGTANTNDLGTIYAPTSAGTGFLKGTAGANGTITWSWDNSTYNNYELPTASSDTLGGVKTGSAITDTTGYTAVKVKDGVVYYKDTNTWTAADLNNAGYVPKSTKGKFLHANSSTGALEWTDDNNTWNAASTSLAGYVPKLALASTATIATLNTEYVLTYISGTETAPVWRKLPTNAFNNTWTAWAGASSSSNGTAGYMPAPGTANYLKFLRGDGTWCSLNNYSLPTATDSALGGVKVGTTLTSTTGYTKVHIKDSFIYYKDTNTWQAANTSQVGYVPATSADALLYTNSSGATAWGSPTLLSIALNGSTDTASGSEESSLAYKDTLSFFFGSCIHGFIDTDGINIYHDSYHSNALTIGSSTASSGGTVAVPYITVDLYGHVTGGGTHDHTISVSGYLPTGGGTMTGAITIPHDTLAIKINGRTGSGIKYDWSGNEALMISARSYASASILFYAGMGNNTTKSLNNTTGQWSTTGTGAMGTPSMLMKYSSVLINTPVQTGALSGDYASALYVTGDTYLDGGVKTAGSLWTGTTSDTSERLIGVKSSAGTLYMYSQGSSTGNRGLYVAAHGDGSDKGIIDIDANNNATFYGNVSGSATSAGSASTAGSAGSATYSTYLSSNTGGIAANTTNSLTYYNTATTTTLSTTNGVANPTTAGSGTWYHHITMVRGDSNGFFFDLAFSLADANNPKIYFRNRASSNYSAWTEIVTSANADDYLTGGGSITLKNKTFSNLGSSTTYRLVYAYNQSTTADSTLNTLYQTSGLYVNNNGVYHTSDVAYKEDIEKYILKKNILDLENPVKKFKWKGTGDEAVGFIAQETELWCPEAVGQDEDGYKTVNYTVALSGLCSALYDEIKNLKKEIEELKNKKC